MTIVFHSKAFYSDVSSIIYSQYNTISGYIVLNSLDTFYGEIIYQNTYSAKSYCGFRQSDTTAFSGYLPNEIKSFYTANNALYVSKTFVLDNVERKTFLQQLFMGAVNIYRYTEGPSHIDYFVENDKNGISLLPFDEKLVSDENKTGYLKSTKHIGLIKYYMSDVTTRKFANKIEHLRKPTSNKFVHLAKEYHTLTCENEDCIVYNYEEDEN